MSILTNALSFTSDIEEFTNYNPKLDLRPVHLFFANSLVGHAPLEAFYKTEPTLPRKIVICTSWNDLINNLKLRPKSLCVSSEHLKTTSIIETIGMIETFSELLNLDKNLSISVAIDNQTPFNLIKETQRTKITGVIPACYDFGIDETVKGLNAQWNNIPYWPKHILEKLPGAVKPKHTLTPEQTVKLTPRQQQIFDIITKKACSNKHVAKILNISESTVKLHLSLIFKKYGVRTRTQLAVFAHNSEAQDKP
jgi:DNA-binding NarL/FixJ family response regulator